MKEKELSELRIWYLVGQHSTPIIMQICDYLSSFCNIFNFTVNCPQLKPSKTLNQDTKVLTIPLQNIDSLHDILAYNLISIEFQTRKRIDFMY